MRSSKTNKPTRPLTEEEARLRLKKQSRVLNRQRRAQNWLVLLLITFSLLVPFTSPYWRVRHVVITGVQGSFTPAEAETLQQTLTTSKYTNWLRARRNPLRQCPKTPDRRQHSYFAPVGVETYRECRPAHPLRDTEYQWCKIRNGCEGQPHTPRT